MVTNTPGIHGLLLQLILEVQATPIDVIYPCSVLWESPACCSLSEFRTSSVPGSVLQNSRELCQRFQALSHFSQ